MNIGFHLALLLEAMMKLGMTMGLCFIMALEREWHSHPGGVTTHMLCGIGACLFTMISVQYNEINGTSGDPMRVAAQIVSGIGFLGSATVYKSENYVKGINTAASLWISTGVGMSVGVDMWEFGMITSLFTVLVFILNNRYKKYIYGKMKKSPSISEKLDELTDIYIDESDDEHRCKNDCEVCEPYNSKE